MTKWNGVSLKLWLIVFALASALSNAHAATPAFGPNQYSGKPKVQAQNVTFVLPQAGSYRIEIQNGKPFTPMVCSGGLLARLLCTLKNVAELAESVASRIASGKITINNVQVAGPSELNLLKESFSKTVQLPKTSQMKLELQGLNNSRLVLAIYAQGAVNQPPVARIVANPVSGPAPLNVSFNGIQSTDDSGVTSYSWSFGDGDNASGVQVNHTYTSSGNVVATLTVADSMGLTSSSAVTISVQGNTLPVAAFTLSPSSGRAPLLVLFDATGSSDVEGAIQYQWDFADGSPIVTTSAVQTTHDFQLPGTYNIKLTVLDSQGGASSVLHSIVVQPVVIAPDPASQAPQMPTTVASSFSDSYSFLYSGSNPVQVGVVPGSIVASRMSVLQGRALQADGNPLQGVTIKIPSHPEWGSTTSRGDGKFDLAVNGGGPLIVDYTRNGYFSVQREVSPDYEGFSSIKDVVMIQPDSKSSLLQINSAVSQVAQSSTVTDGSGSRQGSVLVPAGTTAEAVLQNGSRVNLKQMTIRITEFTVGENGEAKMPAVLPATSGYTYAADYSVDEARALGAKSVEFSKSIPIYADNFLNFNIGVAVPIGVYDPQLGVWKPEANGRVIKILSESGGQAVLDVLGNGQPATSQDLASLGITLDELTKLAVLYEPQKSLWRASTTHFSTIDWNHPINPLGGGDQPPAKGVETLQVQNPLCVKKKKASSEIDIDRLILTESIPLVGSPFRIVYSSGRAPGKKSALGLNINLAANIDTSGLREIGLRIDVAGKTYTQTFSPQQYLDTRFEWDGVDSYGRKVNSSVKAKVTIEYLYDAVYYESRTYNIPLFGRLDGFTATSVPARGVYSISNTYSSFLGNNLVQANQDLGLWDLEIHHSFDPLTKTVTLGNGDQKVLALQGQMIETIAGTGISGFGGDGLPALQASFRRPTGLTTGPDGSLYISDPPDHRIRKIDPNGIISTYVGTGVLGNSGNGGPATSAQIDSPARPAMGSDGSLYFSDATFHVIRKVSPSGIISQIAGTGIAGYGGDNGPASVAQLNTPRGVLIANDGSIILDDSSNHRVRRIGTDGIITTIAGTGVAGYTGDGGPGIQARLNGPFVVSMGNSGEIYIADRNNHAIRKLSPSGIIETVAGTGTAGFSGDGGVAQLARLQFPASVDVKPSGEIVIADTQNFRIRQIDLRGRINTLAGRGTAGFEGDTGYASQALLNSPTNVKVGPDGSVFVSDSDNFRIRRIRLVGGIQADGKVYIASDSGDEVFVFAQSGRHLSTLFSKTGSTKYAFSYDASGRLVQVNDAFNGLTRITRDSQGRATSIQSPDGFITQLSTNSDGLLASVTNPSGETFAMNYGSGGLLSSFSRPKGNTTQFTYDSLGQIKTDVNPSGGTLTYTKTSDSINSIYFVEQLSSEGNRVSTSIRSDDEGQMLSRTTSNGLTSFITMTKPGTVSFTSNVSGSVITSQSAPDPRFGLASSFPNTITERNGTVSKTTTAIRSVAYLSPNNLFDFQETTSVSTNGRVGQVTYHSPSRIEQSTSPLGRQRSVRLDSMENPIEIQNGNLASLLFSYDGRGRIVGQNHGGRLTSFTYNSAGLLDSTTDPTNQKQFMNYDNAGRLSESIDASGRITKFSYDLNGNLTGVQPYGRLVHSFSYNSIDEVSASTPPSLFSGSTNTTYQYDLDKRLKLTSRPDGKTLTYQYGQDGNIQRIFGNSSAENTSFTYNADQMNSTRSADLVDLSITYNGKLPNRYTVQGVGLFTAVLNFTHNNDFLASSYSIGSVSVPLQYDNDLLMVRAGSLTISRDAANGLISGTSLGSIGDSYAYNNFGELLSYASPGLSVNFTRDTLGRISNKTESFQGGSQNQFVYSYDLSGRLINVLKNGVLLSEYAYDSNSNRTSINGISAAYDSQDRIISFGSITYGFNANGDLNSKVNTLTGQNTSYVYDGFGSLKSASLPGGTLISYKTDGLNRRVARLVNGALERGWVYINHLNPIAEIDASGNVSSVFIYGSRSNVPDAMVRGGITYRIISDHLGSPRLVVNSATGVVVQAIDYDALGNIIFDSNPGFQPFGFTGGLYDSSTGLVRIGARDYDPQIGRWTAKDPVSFDGGDSNLYAYAGNDPINRIDQTGTDWTDATDVIAHFTAGVANSLSFGLSNALMSATGNGNAINRCSVAFRAGEGAALIVSIGRLTYAASAKLASVFAKNAQAASAARNAIKTFFRIGPWGSFRTFDELLIKHNGNMNAVKEAAGKTNIGYNYWAGATSETVGISATTNCECN